MNTIPTHYPQDNLGRIQVALQNYQPPRAIVSTAQSGLYADILVSLSREKAGRNWRAISHLWDTYERGLRYARQGKLSSAEQVFAEAHTARAPFVANSILDQLINVGALPAVAYLYYKQEHYAEAEGLLINSLDNDVSLLTEGIYILEHHRVQQLHNLARLYFRQGRLVEGASLIAMALKYLVYKQIPTVGNGKGWSSEPTHAIANELRSDMLLQLTSETVGIFLTHPTEFDTLSQISFSNLTCWNIQTPNEFWMRTWFALIEPGHRSYWQLNLSGLITFLTTSPPSFDQLKMALILWIVTVSDQFTLASSGLQESIRDFMSKLQLSQPQRESCSLFVNQLLVRSQ